jgi:hypothetical protein
MKRIERLQRIVDDFNRRFPIGSEVLLRKDSEEVRTRVRFEGYVLQGHSAVAFFEGVSGCYSIEDNRVQPIEEEQSCQA